MKLTLRQVQQATARVRRNLNTAEHEAVRGNRNGAFAAAQDAWQNAFDLMQLFALTDKEMPKTIPVANDPEAQ
jgi:hypothetical protein